MFLSISDYYLDEWRARGNFPLHGTSGYRVIALGRVHAEQRGTNRYIEWHSIVYRISAMAKIHFDSRWLSTRKLKGMVCKQVRFETSPDLNLIIVIIIIIN